MNKRLKKINDDEIEEENFGRIDNTEENVINNKNKIYYFSLINISKYKNNYKENQNIYNSKKDNIKANNIDKNISKEDKYIYDEIIDIDNMDNEDIDKQYIIEEINELSDNNHNKKKLNIERDIYGYNFELKKNLFESRLPSEQIFLRQKKKIQLMKERNNKNKFSNLLKNLNKSHKIINLTKHKKNSSNIFNEINSALNDNISNKKLHSIIKRAKSFKETNFFISLDFPQFFEISYLQKNIRKKAIENEEIEEEVDNEFIPIFKNNWESIRQFKKINNYIEFSNMALRTVNEVNYSTNGVEISIELSLTANSEMWIFSRCFENNDIYDSEFFETSSINNESDVIFNKYTSLIKIIKEKNSCKCFITFGIFYEDESDGNKIKYETFLKRQLVDFSQIESLNMNVNKNSLYYYLENDLIDLKAIIVDLGNEIIDAKIFINKNKEFNHIEGKFFLPTIKSSKLLFCGIGPSVQIKKLIINNIEKIDENESNDYNKKACTCCNIY